MSISKKITHARRRGLLIWEKQKQDESRKGGYLFVYNGHGGHITHKVADWMVENTDAELIVVRCGRKFLVEPHVAEFFSQNSHLPRIKQIVRMARALRAS